MPRSYSQDFRRLVVEKVSSGMSWDQAIDTFNISRDSLGRWLRLFKAKESLADKPRAAYKTRKIDSKQLLLLVEKNSDATLAELALSFNCTTVAIHKRLKKLGITRKKNHVVR